MVIPGILLPEKSQKGWVLRSDAAYPPFIDNDTAEELLTPLLTQLNFQCECGIC